MYKYSKRVVSLCFQIKNPEVELMKRSLIFSLLLGGILFVVIQSCQNGHRPARLTAAVMSSMTQPEWVRHLLAPVCPVFEAGEIPGPVRPLVEGLLRIRTTYPFIQSTPASSSRPQWQLLPSSLEDVQVASLRGADQQGNSCRLIWLENMTAEKQRVKIPKGYYAVLCYENRADVEPIGSVSGMYAYVPAQSSMILLEQ